MAHSPHTDIRQDGLIDRFFPAALIPYLKLARFDRPVGVWLTVLPGFWGLTLATAHADQGFPVFYFLLFILGGFAARGAGCIINDIWDRKLDRKVERTAARPLASGKLSLFQALSLLFFLLTGAFAVLAQLPLPAIVTGVFALIPIALYPAMKRITFWPQLFLGLTFNLSILIGWLCFMPELSLTPCLLYIAAIFLTLGYDTVYAFQDIEDDLKIGIKSTAIKFQNRPKFFVGLCYGIGFVLLCFAAKTFWVLLPAGLHLIWQITIWQPENRASSLRSFKAHVIFQLLIWIGLLLLLF